MDSTLLKGLNILEFVVEATGPVSITGLARELDLPKSNIHRTVTSLRAAGYLLYNEEDRRYFPSLKLAQMGKMVQMKFPFRHAIQPYLDQLVAATNESAHFAFAESGSVVFSANTVPDLPLTSVIPDNLALKMQDSAFGIAIASGLTETCPIDNGDPAWPMVIKAREDGYAFVKKHNTRRIFEIAAPVLTRWNVVIGAIGVTGPAARLTEPLFAKYVGIVKDVAHQAFLEVSENPSNTFSPKPKGS